MAYGTFGNSIVNHYNKTTYSIGRDSYTVHIFKTDSATEKVAPAVYVNENLQLLKNMNANGIDKSRTIAKINGNVMGGNAGFFGWFYADGKLYKQGEECTTGSYGYGFRDFPTFCIKDDDSVIIRWFTSAQKLSVAMAHCVSMISGTAALVYNGMSVFENDVNSEDSNILIVNRTNYEDTNCHFNTSLSLYSGSGEKAIRTILGYCSDKTYYLVVVESSITLRDCAKMMEDLGCDFALNLDGNYKSQMRVAPNYTNSVTNAGYNLNSTTTYGSAVVAYRGD